MGMALAASLALTETGTVPLAWWAKGQSRVVRAQHKGLQAEHPICCAACQARGILTAPSRRAGRTSQKPGRRPGHQTAAAEKHGPSHSQLQAGGQAKHPLGALYRILRHILGLLVAQEVSALGGKAEQR